MSKEQKSRGISKQQVGRAGKYFVVAELNKRGAFAVPFAGNMPKFGRDFIYVKDAVDMTIYFMESSVGGLFNIGSGRMTTWNELAGAIFAALGQPPSIEYIEMPESIRGQYQYYTKANLARMRNTGYVRKPTPIAEAVSDYVVNYLLADKRLGE